MDFVTFTDSAAKESARLGGAVPAPANPPQPAPPASTLHVFTGRANTAAITGEAAADGTGIAGVSAGGIAVYGRANGGGLAGLFKGDVKVDGHLDADLAVANVMRPASIDNELTFSGERFFLNGPAMASGFKFSWRFVDRRPLVIEPSPIGPRPRGDRPAQPTLPGVGMIERDWLVFETAQQRPVLPEPGPIRRVRPHVPARIRVPAGIAFIEESDERGKDDIRPIDDPLDRVAGLSGVSFAWKCSGQPGVGVVAQDVARVLPDAVSADARTGRLAVNYNGLTAVLIEAVKTLAADNRALASRLERLEKATWSS